jgi:hypothetical protein
VKTKLGRIFGCYKDKIIRIAENYKMRNCMICTLCLLLPWLLIQGCCDWTCMNEARERNAYKILFGQPQESRIRGRMSWKFILRKCVKV